MSRWTWPGAIMAVVVAAVIGLAFVPVAQPPSTTVSVAEVRVSTVCPMDTNEGITQKIAVASLARPVQLASLGSRTGAEQEELLTVISKPTAWMQISTFISESSGGMTWLTAPGTAERGMSSAPCLEPDTEHWFTGVSLTADTQASIMLANLDDMDAAADVTIWTLNGPAAVAGLGSIKIPAGRTTEVPLNVALMTDEVVAVRVSVTQGRVAGYLRQHLWQGSAPRGADWIPVGQRPSTRLVVPGIPAGTGVRTLVVANPSAGPVVVNVDVLGEAGVSALPESGVLEVPAQSVISVDITAELEGQAGSLRLTTTESISAGMILSSDTSEENRDPAYLAAIAPLASDGLWPLPLGADVSSTLQLTNASETEATVKITTSVAPSAEGKVEDISLPPGTMVTLELPKQDVTVVRVETSGTDMYGAVVASGKVSDITGLAVVPLIATTTEDQMSEISYDPNAGS